MGHNNTPQTGTVQSGHPADDDSTARDHPTRRRVLRASAAFAATGVVDTAAADHMTNGTCSIETMSSASVTLNRQTVSNDCGDLFDSPDAMTVERAKFTCPNGGFIDLHHTTMPAEPSGSFPPGYPIGATGHFEKGTFEDICIDLYEPEGFFTDPLLGCIEWNNSEWPVDGNPRGTAPMTAILHLNTDGNEEFTHYCQHESHVTGTDHAYLNAPKDPVMDKATIIGDGPG